VPKLALNIPLVDEQMSKISSRNGPSVSNLKPEKTTAKTLQDQKTKPRLSEAKSSKTFVN